jgi:hypothetical protein
LSAKLSYRQLDRGDFWLSMSAADIEMQRPG